MLSNLPELIIYVDTGLEDKGSEMSKHVWSINKSPDLPWNFRLYFVSLLVINHYIVIKNI